MRVLAVLLSAACVPLCFPPLGWWPCALLAYAPLLVATRNTTRRYALVLGFLHGVLGLGSSLFWLFDIFGGSAVPLFFILAAFSALFCFLNNELSKFARLQGVVGVFLTAMLWVGIEFYRCELFSLRFPWITPGSAMGPTYLSPILGVYGMSFVVVAALAAVTQRKTLPFGIALALVVVSLGSFRPGLLKPSGSSPDSSFTVTLIQSEECVVEAYLDLTRKANAATSDLIVWPEYALPYDVRERPSVLAQLVELCAELDAVLVVGTKTTRVRGGWHNTALTLNAIGVLGEYYKARPVHFFDDGVAGTQFEPVQTPLGNVATPICFDCDYSDVSRQLAAHGAEFFASPTFDAKSWSVTQHQQHALLFRLRAAENRRWFVSAASSGVSQVIDPHGNVHGSIAAMEIGSLTRVIGKSKELTFFTRWGWYFPWIALVISGVLIVSLIAAAIRRQRAKRAERQAYWAELKAKRTQSD